MNEESKELVIPSYGDVAGEGFEEITAEDEVVPFLSVLQSLSAICEEEGSEAKAGMLLNSVTNELIDGKQGLVIVPAYIQRLFVEWVPREFGGGFVGFHQIDSEVVEAAKKRCRDNGEDPRFTQLKVTNEEDSNDLIDTYYLYAVICEDDCDVGEIGRAHV